MNLFRKHVEPCGVLRNPKDILRRPKKESSRFLNTTDRLFRNHHGNTSRGPKGLPGNPCGPLRRMRNVDSSRILGLPEESIPQNPEESPDIRRTAEQILLISESLNLLLQNPEEFVWGPAESRGNAIMNRPRMFWPKIFGTLKSGRSSECPLELSRDAAGALRMSCPSRILNARATNNSS